MNIGKYLAEFGIKEISLYLLGCSMGIFLTLVNPFAPDFRETMQTVGVMAFVIGAGGLLISILLKMYNGEYDE